MEFFKTAIAVASSVYLATEIFSILEILLTYQHIMNVMFNRLQGFNFPLLHILPQGLALPHVILINCRKNIIISINTYSFVNGK